MLSPNIYICDVPQIYIYKMIFNKAVKLPFRSHKYSPNNKVKLLLLLINCLIHSTINNVKGYDTQTYIMQIMCQCHNGIETSHDKLFAHLQRRILYFDSSDLKLSCLHSVTDHLFFLCDRCFCN